MKKRKKFNPTDYIIDDDANNYGYVWQPWVFIKYTDKQINRLSERLSKHGYNVAIGQNMISDLYKRIAALERKKK